MTREEAIKHLETYSTTNGSGQTTQAQHEESKQMAIKALEQEPCDDCISRQAVLDIASTIQTDDFSGNELLEVVEVDDIKALPPVTPQPKTGHWIIEKWNNKEHYSCSSCQHVVDYEPCYHYCPYCGAKMVEPQESEE